jgi:hypothetical protein
MKMRIKGDSIRMRLTRGEVRELDERGQVADRLCIAPGAELTYRVRRDAAASTLTATFAANVIELQVPQDTAREWCNSDLVTLEYSRKTVDGELRLVVEKDFTCLVPRSGEDESDHFPHPKSPASC